MKKLLLFTLLFLLASKVPTFASEASFEVYPPITEISAGIPSAVETKITISNQKETPQDLNIILRSFQGTSNNSGGIELLPEDTPPGADPLLFEKIEFFDGESPVRKFHLNSFETKSLKMKIRLDETSQTGDYYFSVIFMAEGQAPDKGSGSRVNLGIGTNVLLTIGKADSAKGEIKSFTTSFFKEKGPVAFTLLVSNSSRNFIKPKGEVIINNIFGQTVGKLELIPQNILAGTSRYMKDKKQIEPKEALQKQLNSLKLKNEVVLWPETFLLGIYKAKVTLKMSENGPTITADQTFLALPVLWVAGFSLVVLLILGIGLRVMKKI